MEKEWCPKMKGKYRAYMPQWLDGDKWRDLPIEDHPTGVPQPMGHGGINRTIGLFGYSQAMALAWSGAALAESHGKQITVRAHEYEVEYDIRAREVDGGREECGDAARKDVSRQTNG